MPTCEFCNQRFDTQIAEDDFNIEMFGLSYNQLRKCLCGSCAIMAIRNETSGIYYETCEVCGKDFDLITERTKFALNFPWYNGTRLDDHWGDALRCADCALKKIEEDDILYNQNRK